MVHHRFWILTGLISAYLIYQMVIPFLDVLIYSIFIYYISRPLYQKINKQISSHPISAFISLFLLLLPLSLIILYGSSVAVYELLKFLNTWDFPYVQIVSSILSDHAKAVSALSPEKAFDLIRNGNEITGGFSFLSILIMRFLDVILRVVLAFIVASFLLQDGPKLKKWLVEVLYPKEKELTNQFFQAIDHDMHRVFYGSIQTALIIAFMGFLMTALLDTIAPVEIKLRYNLLFGMVCGMASLIPMIGAALFYVPLIVFLFIYSYAVGILASTWWFLLLFLMVSLIFVDYGPNMIFKPHIAGKNVHSGLMMLAYILGPMTFGIAGIFMGPMILVFTFNFARIILPQLRKK